MKITPQCLYNNFHCLWHLHGLFPSLTRIKWRKAELQWEENLNIYMRKLFAFLWKTRPLYCRKQTAESRTKLLTFFYFFFFFFFFLLNFYHQQHVGILLSMFNNLLYQLTATCVLNCTRWHVERREEKKKYDLSKKIKHHTHHFNRILQLELCSFLVHDTCHSDKQKRHEE